MHMMPRRGGVPVPRAAYGISIAHSNRAFRGQNHPVQRAVVAARDPSVFEVHLHGDLLPALSEYVPPAQNLMVSRVRDLFEGGHNLPADGFADVDLRFQLLFGPDDPLDGPGQALAVRAAARHTGQARRHTGGERLHLVDLPLKLALQPQAVQVPLQPGDLFVIGHLFVCFPPHAENLTFFSESTRLA